jgi:hypothetical protein
VAAGLQINHEARRLTLPSGRINGFAYIDLIRMLSKAQDSERLTTGRLLALAHGHSTGTPCDACWDEATLLTLEAHGWTIERR